MILKVCETGVKENGKSDKGAFQAKEKKMNIRTACYGA